MHTSSLTLACPVSCGSTTLTMASKMPLTSSSTSGEAQGILADTSSASSFKYAHQGHEKYEDASRIPQLQIEHSSRLQQSWVLSFVHKHVSELALCVGESYNVTLIVFMGASSRTVEMPLANFVDTSCQLRKKNLHDAGAEMASTLGAS